MINKSKPSIKKYRVEFLDADEVLRKRCLKQVERLYGIPSPDMVRERLDLELSAIATHNYSSEYLIGAMIADESMKYEYPVSVRGMIGSAFVSYLCGLSAVNPLAPHRVCPKCHYFETVNIETGLMSYDLPDTECPHCGSLLNVDGADIQPEILMGKELEREPDIVLNVAAEIRPQLVEYLKATFGEKNVFRAGVRVELEDGSIRRNVHPGGIFIIPDGVDIYELTNLRESVSNDGVDLLVTETDYHEIYHIIKKYDLLCLKELSMIRMMERITGFNSNQIKTNDQELIDLFVSEGLPFLSREKNSLLYNIQNRVIETTQPHTFSDFYRISAMMHDVGAWNENGEILIRDGKKFHDLIICRDDILDYLINIGLDRQYAFEIMNRVAKGKGLTDEMMKDMKSAGVPDWYIDSCKKIKYLFPRSHALEYMLLYWKLGYYKLHFQKEFRVATKNTHAKTR